MRLTLKIKANDNNNLAALTIKYPALLANTWQMLLILFSKLKSFLDNVRERK